MTDNDLLASLLDSIGSDNEFLFNSGGLLGPDDAPAP